MQHFHAAPLKPTELNVWMCVCSFTGSAMSGSNFEEQSDDRSHQSKAWIIFKVTTRSCPGPHALTQPWSMPLTLAAQSRTMFLLSSLVSRALPLTLSTPLLRRHLPHASGLMHRKVPQGPSEFSFIGWASSRPCRCRAELETDEGLHEVMA